MFRNVYFQYFTKNIPQLPWHNYIVNLCKWRVYSFICFWHPAWFATILPITIWSLKQNGRHSKNKVVKWTTLGLSNWCQKRTPQSRPKLVIWVSRRMTTLMSSQKQPESRQMTTFFTGFSVIWRLSYHLRTTEWQTSNRQMMVLWLICDKS